MRDDLISRKALLKQFIVSDSGRRIPEYDIDNFQITLSIKDVKDIIRKAPTAFDKEKVTQELKSNMESAQLVQSLVGTDLVQCGGFSYGYYNGVKDAIKIVEKGGIE